jgi:hypothetical protein
VALTPSACTAADEPDRHRIPVNPRPAPKGLGPNHHVHQNLHTPHLRPHHRQRDWSRHQRDVKGVITRVSPRESEGLYQTTDLKVIIGTAELGTYYPTEADRIQYLQAGATREAKIIAITTYRGDNPVLHTLIARPQ